MHPADELVKFNADRYADLSAVLEKLGCIREILIDDREQAREWVELAGADDKLKQSEFLSSIRIFRRLAGIVGYYRC